MAIYSIDHTITCYEADANKMMLAGEIQRANEKKAKEEGEKVSGGYLGQEVKMYEKKR